MKRENPDIEIVLRTHSEEESQLLRKTAIGAVFFGEEELAKGMTRHVLERFAPRQPARSECGGALSRRSALGQWPVHPCRSAFARDREPACR